MSTLRDEPGAREMHISAPAHVAALLTRSRYAVAWCGLAYLLLTLILTHPLWRDLRRTVASDVVDPLLNTWILAWDQHALIRDPLHLFDANIFFPAANTLAGSENLLGTALLTAPLGFAIGEPVLTYNLAFLSAFVLSGLGMYLFVLNLTHSRFPAFLAGLAFAFAPYHMGALLHLHLLTVQWLPFTALFLQRYLRRSRPRDLVWFGFFLWLQLAASWHAGAFTLFVVAAMLLYAVARRELRLRSAAAVAVALLSVLILILPLAVPYLQAKELQGQRPLSFTTNFAATYADYLSPAASNRLFGNLLAAWRQRPQFNLELQLFPGLATPLLALCALAWLRRKGGTEARRHVIFFWLLALAAIPLTLGPTAQIGRWQLPMPYKLIDRLLPQFSMLRVPARWVSITVFALAVAAGFGAFWLLGAVRQRFGRLASGCLAACLALALLADSWSVPIPIAFAGTLQDLSPVYSWLARQPGDFGVVELPLFAWPRAQYDESKRLYASTLHWKKLVNGNSGVTPAAYQALDVTLQGFPAAPATDALVALAHEGVRYLVVHAGQGGFDEGRWVAGGRQEAERSIALFPRYQLPDRHEYVYEINPYGAALFTGPAALSDTRWAATAQKRVDAVFGGQIALIGYETRQEGADLVLDLYWQARAPVPASYKVFVHVLNGQGERIAQGDDYPAAGSYLTTAWQIGEAVRDSHRVNLGETKSAASFLVGFYLPETGERLPVGGSNGQPGDTLTLALNR